MYDSSRNDPSLFTNGNDKTRLDDSSHESRFLILSIRDLAEMKETKKREVWGSIENSKGDWLRIHGIDSVLVKISFVIKIVGNSMLREKFSCLAPLHAREKTSAFIKNDSINCLPRNRQRIPKEMFRCSCSRRYQIRKRSNLGSEKFGNFCVMG